jgi:DNA-binding IclR family transcriptional regulator
MAASPALSTADHLQPVADPRDLYRIQCLDRAIDLLELLSECHQLPTLAGICQHTGLHKSTAHRLLMVLQRSGIIERTADHRYHLGLKLHELGQRALDQVDLRARARPHFRRLAAQVHETVHLGVLQKAKVVYLEKLDANNHAVCFGSIAGTSNPVYCTAMGKAILAFLAPDIADEVIAGIRFRRFTANTLCSEPELRRALERVRRRGYAVDDEEIEPGVRCIGAPVFGPFGTPVAAVSISGSVARITPQRAPGIADHLLRCCREMSLSLSPERRSSPPLAVVRGSGANAQALSAPAVLQLTILR